MSFNGLQQATNLVVADGSPVQFILPNAQRVQGLVLRQDSCQVIQRMFRIKSIYINDLFPFYDSDEWW